MHSVLARPLSSVSTQILVEWINAIYLLILSYTTLDIFMCWVITDKWKLIFESSCWNVHIYGYEYEHGYGYGYQRHSKTSVAQHDQTVRVKFNVKSSKSW